MCGILSDATHPNTVTISAAWLCSIMQRAAFSQSIWVRWITAAALHSLRAMELKLEFRRRQSVGGCATRALIGAWLTSRG